MLSPEGAMLTDESVCEIMLSCFRICFETRLTGKVISTLLTCIIRLLFLCQSEKSWLSFIFRYFDWFCLRFILWGSIGCWDYLFCWKEFVFSRRFLYKICSFWCSIVFAYPMVNRREVIYVCIFTDLKKGVGSGVCFFFIYKGSL